jgi:hypothetical protein
VENRYLRVIFWRGRVAACSLICYFGVFHCFLLVVLSIEPLRRSFCVISFIALLRWCTKYSCSRVLVICAGTHVIINIKQL